MTTRRFSHYITLFGIFITAIVGFYLFTWDRTFQIALVIATATAYIAWGIVHHWLHDDFYFEVVLEYGAIALAGSILAIILLL